MIKRERLNSWSLVALALLGLALGYVVANLVVAGNWTLALGFVLILPGAILLHKYPLMGLFMWLVLAPFLMNTPTDTLRRVYWVVHRALPPATVGLIVLSSLLRVRDHRLPKLGIAELAMGGYLLVSLISIIYLSNNVRATTYLLFDSVFVPMCLYLIIRLSEPTEADLARLMPLLLGLSLVQVLVGLISWTVPGALPSMWRNQHLEGRTIGTLINPTTYTLGLMFCSLLLVQAGLNRKPGPLRTLYLAGFIASNFFVFLSFTRSSWLGALLVLVGLMVLYPGFIIRLSLVVALVMGISGGVLLADQLEHASDRLYSNQSEESALSRLPIIYASLRMYLARPISGWGYNNFDRYDREFQGRVGDLVNAEKDHASHNTFLTLLAEQGTVGCVLFMMPMLWWLAKTRKSVRELPQEGFWSSKLLIVYWLFILFYVVVNNFFRVYIVFGLGLYWITLGLIAVIIEAGQGNDSATHTRQHRFDPWDRQALVIR